MLLGLVLVALATGRAAAAPGVVTPPQEPTAQTSPAGQQWEAPAPQDDGFDWIKLNTGEWLKGRLLAMQDGRLEFDSEKLHMLEFDWEDVAEVRTTNLLQMLLTSSQRVAGPVTITTDQVTVAGPIPRSFPRTDLVSITRGGESRLDLWSGNLSLGLTLRKGNTEEVQYNAIAKLQRRTPNTRLKFDYVGNLSSVDGQRSANNQRLGSEFDLWLSKRLYLVIPFAEYFTDEFQNINHRVTVSAGPAYYLIDTSKMRWSINAGPAYQSTRFDSVAAGAEDGYEAPAFFTRTEFEWEVTKRIDLAAEYQGQFTTEDLGSALHHVVTTLDVELTSDFDLEVSFIWDRVESPQADDTGETPDNDDYRLVVGVKLSF